MSLAKESLTLKCLITQVEVWTNFMIHQKNGKNSLRNVKEPWSANQMKAYVLYVIMRTELTWAEFQTLQLGLFVLFHVSFVKLFLMSNLAEILHMSLKLTTDNVMWTHMGWRLRFMTHLVRRFILNKLWWSKQFTIYRSLSPLHSRKA